MSGINDLDCWNRIGVFGDKRCPRLPEQVHCRNCEVYSEGATLLLERYGTAAMPAGEPAAAHEQAAPQDIGPLLSLLIFRLGTEWLALPTLSLLEVRPDAAVHSVPHRRSAALLGVANQRGALLACLSLAELLRLPECARAPGGSLLAPRPVHPRMLVLAGSGGPVMLPVDEVDGIHRLPTQAVLPPSGSGQVLARLTRGVLRWQQRSVTLLDEQQLREAVAGSFA